MSTSPDILSRITTDPHICHGKAVVRVEETIGPNAQVNSFDAPRPISWYRLLPAGNKVFYTALGHAQSNYTTDTLFREHIADALAWLLEPATWIAKVPGSSAMEVFPDPANSELNVILDANEAGRSIRLYDMLGQLLISEKVEGARTTVNVQDLRQGSISFVYPTRAPRYGSNADLQNER